MSGNGPLGKGCMIGCLERFSWCVRIPFAVGCGKNGVMAGGRAGVNGGDSAGGGFSLFRSVPFEAPGFALAPH